MVLTLSRSKPATDKKKKIIFRSAVNSVCNRMKQTRHCVVPENIHTPTTEGIGNSGGVGGVKSPGKSRGEGG